MNGYECDDTCIFIRCMPKQSSIEVRTFQCSSFTCFTE